jgi:hypothetical protein
MIVLQKLCVFLAEFEVAAELNSQASEPRIPRLEIVGVSSETTTRQKKLHLISL